MRGNRGLDDLGLVRPRAIPDDNTPPGDVVFEQTEVFQGELGIDVGVLVESKDETDPAAFGRHNNGCDGGDLLMRSGTMVETGGMSPRCPGATNERCHQKAAFVNERQRGLQCTGFFLCEATSPGANCGPAARCVQRGGAGASATTIPGSASNVRDDQHDIARRST